MKKILYLLIAITFCSCEKEEITTEGIPSYIQINEIVLEDESVTSNITDAWVYIDEQLQGVYELPANFPVLAEGKHKLRIKAGIKDNGIASTRVIYPLYSSFIIDEQEFIADQTILINPEVNYLDSAEFFFEDFEGVGIDIEATTISDTSVIVISNSNNNYASGFLTDSLFTFEIATDKLNNLPQAGAPVYLELDYKCNTKFLVGVYVNFPQSVLQKELLVINQKENWNKIYINLTPTISEAVGADFFKVFIQMKRDFTLDTNTINFDNLKVVY